MSLVIRKIANGYLVGVEGERFDDATAVLTIDELLCEIQDYFDPKSTIDADLPSAEDVRGILAPEQPTQPSTEEEVEGTPASMPTGDCFEHPITGNSVYGNVEVINEASKIDPAKWGGSACASTVGNGAAPETD